MKTYAEVSQMYDLPKWYNEKFHDVILRILREEGKLYACKAIRMASNAEFATFGNKARELSLHQAKELCDFINPIEPAEPQIVISAELLAKTLFFVKEALRFELTLKSLTSKNELTINGIIDHINEHELVKELSNLQPK